MIFVNFKKSDCFIYMLCYHLVMSKFMLMVLRVIADASMRHCAFTSFKKLRKHGTLLAKVK